MSYRDAGDLRRHRAQYDVTALLSACCWIGTFQGIASDIFIGLVIHLVKALVVRTLVMSLDLRKVTHYMGHNDHLNDLRG